MIYSIRPFLGIIIGFCVIMLLIPIKLFSQDPALPNVNQDGYRTSNMGTGEEVSWESENWQKWNGTNWVNSAYPPRDGNKMMYIYIQANDIIRSVAPISYKNQTTLIVCGELYLGTLEIAEEDLSLKNQFDLLVCLGGKLSIGTLTTQNKADLHIDGILIVDVMNFNHNNWCITGTGNISSSEGKKPVITGNNSSNDCKFDGTLPIELLSFTSKADPQQIILNWATASETNNDYFIIERSRDMYSWEMLGSVEGAGFSSKMLSYQFIDLMPQQGLSYYRLKQIDYDGQYETFTALPVMYLPGMDGLDFQVAKTHSQWVIGLPGDDSYQVEVHTLSGRKLFSGAGSNNITIQAPGQPVVIRVFNAQSLPASRVVM